MAKKKINVTPLTTSGKLNTIIKSVRDIMRKDKGLNGDLDRLPQLTWIMFLKFFDDMELIHETEAKLAGKKFHPLIKSPYRWQDWAEKEDGITGPELISFVNNDEIILSNGKRGIGLFTYLKSLQGDDGFSREDIISSIFRGISNRMLNGYLLRDVINKLNEINFSSSDEIHTLSHLYGTLLKQLRDAAGDSGEFYTPRPVVKFMVNVINPKLGEIILDPACGTGGFLIESYTHLEKQCKTTQQKRILDSKSLLGIEAKSLPYLLCQMNLLLHGVESPKIDPLNALRFPLREIGDKDRVDIVLTNPPFGGEEEKGVLSNFPEDKQTTETTLLFLQIIMRKLRRKKKGQKSGRCGIIVPNGVLFGDKVALSVRKELLSEFNIHTIIRLPDGIFAPYTPIPTNILFFEHGTPTDDIWYYEVPVPEGRKQFTKTRPIQIESFEPIIEWWNDRKKNPQAWMVTKKQIIKNNYDLDLHHPKHAKTNQLFSPNELINSINDQVDIVKNNASIIKSMLDSS